MSEAARYEREFRFFGEMCAEQGSPLYASLSRQVADDPRVMRLVEGRIKKQPPSNMLFGAVQYLLLGGAKHRLAAFYPSLGGDRAPDDAYPAFVDFCRTYESRILELVATRRVQTNEVGRSGVLLPALHIAFEHFHREPLYLIEIGASAGLNLLCDQFAYEYVKPEAPDWRRTCGAVSRARTRTQLRGARTPTLPDMPPHVTGRLGIDITPIDVWNDDDVRWVKSLIWADQLHRIELFRAAVQIAREDPPRMIAGDALDVLPEVIQAAPRDAALVVFHSHCTCQMSSDGRAELDAMLGRLSRDRGLAHISLEWLDPDPVPRLHLTFCTDGRRETSYLADYQSHGAWMEWRQ